MSFYSEKSFLNLIFNIFKERVESILKVNKDRKIEIDGTQVSLCVSAVTPHIYIMKLRCDFL